MIVTDPIAEVEQDLAQALAQLHGELGMPRTRSHVHVGDDAVVFVVDGPRLPRLAPDAQARAQAGLDAIVRRLLGRGLDGPIAVTHISSDSLVVVLRLA
jgi:hypothetical protein